MKWFNFSNVGAFQLGIAALLDDFEFISADSIDLVDFQEANSIGGLKNNEDGIKIVWVSENLTPQTLSNGSELLKIRLKAKKNITSLQQAIYLDENILKNLFYTPVGDCIDNVSLEMVADVVGVDDRSSDESESNEKKWLNNERLFCYPNPSNDDFSIVFDATNDFSGLVRFFDVHGRFLHEQSAEFKKGRNILRMDNVLQLPNGVIHISVSGGNESHSTRLVKL